MTINYALDGGNKPEQFKQASREIRIAPGKVLKRELRQS